MHQEMILEYHPAFTDELEKIRDYYEEKSTGLGNSFADEFERQLLSISAMPSRWMFVRNDLQKALMKRFPYMDFFRVIDDETIRVTVVKHEKRYPALGMGRH